MTDPQLMSDAHRFVVRATADTHFSWLRTRLAIERTMMAYTRTAVALIGFGFTIVQFFDRMNQMPGLKPARYPDAAWYLGLALIASGIMSLAVSVRLYFWTLHYLWGEEFSTVAGIAKERRNSPIIATTFVLLVIGVFAFAAVLLRWV